MPFTDHQAKFYAYELTRRAAPNSIDKLASAVASAQVDLNPHQVEAALFAFKSPLSKGALLADEVGLGKTIEAGLVLAQHWAERKRRLLIVTPANLRKQWLQEIEEKFFLPCVILESKSYNQAIRDGDYRPFQPDGKIVICSYQFAKAKAGEIATTPWDLVVIDEAHRLRNVYQPASVIANTIKGALRDRRKLLLTATPLQNSLLELYGLVSVIDDHAFGDLDSFRELFTGAGRQENYDALRTRLKPICVRTLRRQVTGYVSYTNRRAMVEEFTPGESEEALYDLVTDYLKRPDLIALPKSQRPLMTLVLRKLLASSTFAIAGALGTMSNRLKQTLRETQPVQVEDEFGQDFERLEEMIDEWDAEQAPLVPLTPAERAAIEAEIADLDTFAELAASIDHNAKGAALVRALHIAMDKAAELGAARKAIIFTESRRTQEYLLRLLAETPWRDGIVLFNGSNNDPRSRAIYERWLARHKGTDRVSGSKSADMRSAIVDEFRERGQIMIATEAGAEGINLQFCSLVVNYDLPWNPQRIEQRIGRCHRYGQKHDVVVLNFVNRKNEADKRVYELLSEKLKLFEGVFGASDEVLGALESGVDLERRIAEIYQTCRTTGEIESAFHQLQLAMAPEIDQQLRKTRQKLLEAFDDEVREKLRVQQTESRKALGKFERMLMEVTRHELRDVATFSDDGAFTLNRSPFGPAIQTGRYELPRRSDEAHIYRLNHPLAEAVLAQARSRDLPPAEIAFSLSAHEGRISALAPFVGQRGDLAVALLSVAALDEVEEHLIVAAVSDEGEPLDDDVARRLLSLPARVTRRVLLQPSERLEGLLERKKLALGQEIQTRNAGFIDEETEKLEHWADDLKSGLEREIKTLDVEIRAAKKTAKSAGTLAEKLEAQKAIKRLESQRKEKRRDFYEAQDEIDARRDDLIAAMEQKLSQHMTVNRLFTARWTFE
jgi:adenine-specific DNA-methyltransferase